MSDFSQFQTFHKLNDRAIHRENNRSKYNGIKLVEMLSYRCKHNFNTDAKLIF